MKQNRNTMQRSLVREILTDNPLHPTADEIYEQARKQNPSISRGTVYRNLNLLAQTGEIVRLQMPNGPDHYDYQTNAHFHFICRGCNKVMDADISCNPILNSNSCVPKGCKTEGYYLMLYGLCESCIE